MIYHFVSDDNFFLQGVSVIDFHHRNIILHYSESLIETKYLNHGDIAVVYITDSAQRERILYLPEITFCRVIILLQIKNSRQWQTQGKFPWIIPDNISVPTLIHTLAQAEAVLPVLWHASDPEGWINYQHTVLPVPDEKRLPSG